MPGGGLSAEEAGKCTIEGAVGRLWGEF